MPKDLIMPAPVAGFLVENCAPLDCATALLGGPAAQKRFRRLLDDLTTAPLVTRRINAELDALDDLLSLRNVHDDESIEAECFAMIHPENPAIEEICLLVDGLRSARAEEYHLI